jgi:hypothetical protein
LVGMVRAADPDSVLAVVVVVLVTGSDLAPVAALRTCGRCA